MRNKNLNKTIFMVIFTFIFMTINIDVGLAVSCNGFEAESQKICNALEASGTTSGGNSGGNYSQALTKNYAQDINNYFIYGIRISVLKSDGTQLFSKDYMYNITSAYTRYNSTPCSKGGNCSYSSDWNYKSLANINELQRIFNKSNVDADLQSLLSSGLLGKSDLFNSLLSTKKIENAKKLFESFGDINIDDYYNDKNQAYDLFLTWEPLGAFHYSNIFYKGGVNSYFVGTVNELTDFIIENDVPFLYESNGTIKGYWGYTAYGKAYTYGMACRTILEDSGDFGSLVSQKFPRYFSSGEYFGGNLSISDAGYVYQKCQTENSYSQLKGSAQDKTSSLGVGILWFNECIDNNMLLSCDSINNFYGGATNLYNAIITNTADFSAFNNNLLSKNGGKYPEGFPNGVTADWYKDNCMETPVNPNTPPEPKPYNCTPNYGVSNCNSEGLIYQDVNEMGNLDAEYWNNCVFSNTGVYDIDPHKTSDKSASLSYYDENLSATYCDVYCVEGVYANFDTSSPEVLAGSHFTWGYNSKVITTRTCATKSIDKEKFIRDLNVANQAVANELAKNKLYELNKNGQWEDKGAQYEEDKCSIEIAIPPEKCTGQVYGEWPNLTCDVCTEGDYIGNKYEWSGPTETTLYVGGFKGTASISVDPIVSKTQPTHNPVTGGNVDEAVKNVNKIINEFNKCYSFDSNNILNDESSAEIYYQSSNGTYNYSTEMEKNKNEQVLQTNCDRARAVTALTACSGISCSKTSVAVYNCDSHDATKISTTDFSLPDGIFQYVLKNPLNLSLKSVHAWDIDNYNNGRFTLNYFDLGGSNFPVEFNYQRKVVEDGLQIHYNNLGHKKSNQNSTAVDTILGSISQKENIEYGNWSCDYTIKPELIPDPDNPNPNNPDNPDNPGNNPDNPGGPGNNPGNSSKKSRGINVIYREIDLYRPFPDIDNDNRLTGANWCGSNENNERSCAWDNSTSKAAILNNRDVTGDEVYNKDPMYTFIMTPSDIISIRRYNDQNSYTSYTGSYGGKDYDFKCKNGTSCISDYFTELLNMMESYDLPGACKSDNARNISDTSEFHSCRY